MSCTYRYLSQFEKQWHKFCLSFLQDGEQVNSTYFANIVPIDNDFLTDKHCTRYCCSSDDHIIFQGRNDLLRLSVLNLMFKCNDLFIEKKTLKCKINQTTHLENQDKLNTTFSKLTAFFCRNQIVEFLLDGLLSQDNFIVYAFSSVFAQYALKFPETLLKTNDLLARKIHILCSKNQLLFMDLLCHVTKHLMIEIEDKNIDLTLLLETYTTNLHVLTIQLTCFNQLISNAQDNPARQCSKVSIMENFCKHKLCYNLLKLQKTVTGLFVQDSPDISKGAIEEKQTFLDEQIPTQYKEFLLAISCVIDHTAMIDKMLLAKHFPNYSCKYALKTIMFQLERKEYNSEMFKYASDVISYFMEENFENSFRHRQTRVTKFMANNFATEQAINGVFDEEECLTSSSLACLRSLILIILRACLLLANSFTDEMQHVKARPAECLIKLYSILFSLYQTKDTVNHDILSPARIWLNFLMDEDDQLFDAMCHLLQLNQVFESGSHCKELSAYKSDLRKVICPHLLFYCLLQEISFDHLVCIDWLISEETCFEQLFVLYLNIVIAGFSSFLSAMKSADCLLEETDTHSSCCSVDLHKEDNYSDSVGTDVAAKTDNLSLDIAAGMQQCKAISPVKDLASQSIDAENGVLFPDCQHWNEIRSFSQAFASWKELPPIDRSILTKLKTFEYMKESSSNRDIESNVHDIPVLGKPFKIPSSTYLIAESDISISKSTCVKSDSINRTSLLSIQDEISSFSDNFNTPERTETSRVISEDYGRSFSNIPEKSAAIVERSVQELSNGNYSISAGQVMDVFIKLRLKLERFEGKSLSHKSFETVINKLDIVEDLFDSL